LRACLFVPLIVAISNLLLQAPPGGGTGRIF